MVCLQTETFILYHTHSHTHIHRQTNARARMHTHKQLSHAYKYMTVQHPCMHAHSFFSLWARLSQSSACCIRFHSGLSRTSFPANLHPASICFQLQHASQIGNAVGVKAKGRQKKKKSKVTSTHKNRVSSTLNR